MSSSSSTTDSKRWTAFHSALQCFSVWCSEDPEGAQAVFNAVSRHMGSQVTTSCETLFSEQHAREGVNILHVVVTEAHVRKKQGETDCLDIWCESLDPHIAENLAISRQIKEDDATAQEAEEEANELLDLLRPSRKCGFGFDVYEKWSKLPQDDISLWTLQPAEALDATETP
ncbi:hypothetical protein CONPUDRAFT_90588 [Coniophora puteana RWD-64-598 SS2]|uniref:Uncharacterized protein n=1 Tax=Coniophora puteana (strain RWD-64-598) TaxID=741705 RepID=A0A5M3MM96_CONPW|nr:uncharacterized protein CONPUDRAFT_90588 [Coniophora puteana RWD-64-598 SS2]EIW80332.1 hypothetical protein CONPUDRAFT_90588 [Coniophora puteana RWD-64-598 SS2]